MNIIELIQEQVVDCLSSQFDHKAKNADILVNVTSKTFEGDYTVVLFPFVKALRQNPQTLGDAIGKTLVEGGDTFTGYNIIKGFLNLEISASAWRKELANLFENKDTLGKIENAGVKTLVEFSSPNTNKPLHLGHIRNILLGWSCSQILKEVGQEVINTQIVNDRGIAVCKSMMAWKKTGNGQTPEQAGKKGDHFVGDFYVAYDQLLKAEYAEWQTTIKAEEVYNTHKKDDQTKEDFFKSYKNRYFNSYSSLGEETKEMLLKWEDNDPETKNLWKTMNGWVYDGFEETYKSLKVTFDQLYYESDTYLLGKDIIEQQLAAGKFYKEDDGSIWVDLTDRGLDKKILLRSDGTSVYMTQDIGTAKQRYDDHGMNSMVYVVGNEQDYHFKALFETLKLIEEPYSDALFHLSYGMVDLPTGKMKSREGTVVDADDLVAEVISEARSSAQENGNLESVDEVEREDIYSKIGLGALKYFIIKVHPKKRMTFDPKQSVDMQGQTGPYIQNAYVRIKSILRKNEDALAANMDAYDKIENAEKALLIDLLQFPSTLQEAAKQFDPSAIANYSFNLAKDFHRFYHEVRILNASDEAKAFRLTLIETVATILERSMRLLGIEMPSRM